MSSKMQFITLSTWERLATQGAMERVWRVDQVKNSIEFAPGQELKKATVEEICNSRHWTVTINSLK